MLDASVARLRICRRHSAEPRGSFSKRGNRERFHELRARNDWRRGRSARAGSVGGHRRRSRARRRGSASIHGNGDHRSSDVVGDASAGDRFLASVASELRFRGVLTGASGRSELSLAASSGYLRSRRGPRRRAVSRQTKRARRPIAGARRHRDDDASATHRSAVRGGSATGIPAARRRAVPARAFLSGVRRRRSASPGPLCCICRGFWRELHGASCPHCRAS